MKMDKEWNTRTKLVHGGTRRSQWGEVSEAIFMTQGFVYDSAEQAEARFLEAGPDEFIYARYGNPTVAMFEERIAALEGAEDAFATASGMAAVSGALTSMLRAGDHVVAARALFGSCLYVLDEVLTRFGVEVTFVDGPDLDQWRAAIRKDTRAVFFESVANPTLELVDLEAVAALAHGVGATVVVDNVFATPVFSRAIAEGADVVIYSATKHIDGQGRALGGVILGTREFIRGTVEPYIKHTGGSMSPFTAWIMLKGLETVDLRVRAQAATALEIAEALQGNARLARVIYPGHFSHAQHDLVTAQMGQGGTVLALDLAGGQEAAFRFLNALDIVLISNNLGDAKSIATHPATTTHQRLPDATKAQPGITHGLVRLSVGLEDAGDLIDDLTRALDASGYSEINGIRMIRRAAFVVNPTIIAIPALMPYVRNWRRGERAFAMNIHPSEMNPTPDRDAAQEALDVLRDWARAASPEEVADLDPAIARLLPGGEMSNYPALSRAYPEGFEATDAYRASLPDLQNGPASLIRGTKQQLQHVGISNFRLPIRFHSRDNGDLTLETSVTGTVSLEAGKKGINMSRIMRSFYRHAEKTFSFEVMEAALDDYISDLETIDARLQMRFSYPMKVQSLRSGLEGYQYYNIAMELVEGDGLRRKFMHLDYVYSSTCPCSLELSEHARQMRGQLATPHSQRSVARLSIEIEGGKLLWFEDLIDMARSAVPTETQVMVKREDEQAFAELNESNPVFVEDAARLFCEQLLADQRIGDFRVIASHQESLHSHDAVSVVTEGETFAADSIDPKLFATLFHVG